LEEVKAEVWSQLQNNIGSSTTYDTQTDGFKTTSDHQLPMIHRQTASKQHRIINYL